MSHHPTFSRKILLLSSADQVDKALEVVYEVGYRAAACDEGAYMPTIDLEDPIIGDMVIGRAVSDRPVDREFIDELASISTSRDPTLTLENLQSLDTRWYTKLAELRPKWGIRS